MLVLPLKILYFFRGAVIGVVGVVGGLGDGVGVIGFGVVVAAVLLTEFSAELPRKSGRHRISDRLIGELDFFFL